MLILVALVFEIPAWTPLLRSSSPRRLKPSVKAAAAGNASQAVEALASAAGLADWSRLALVLLADRALTGPPDSLASLLSGVSEGDRLTALLSGLNVSEELDALGLLTEYEAAVESADVRSLVSLLAAATSETRRALDVGNATSEHPWLAGALHHVVRVGWAALKLRQALRDEDMPRS